MGNHHAGRQFVAVVESLASFRSIETARDLLDAAAHSLYAPWMPYSRERGIDIEFDDALVPDTTLGRLVVEAFQPDFVDHGAKDEAGGWTQEGEWDDIVARFCKHYNFW